LKPGLTISGRVIEKDTGYEIPNAPIRAWADGSKLPQQTVHADGDGNFEFNTLGAAEYHLIVDGANSDATFQTVYAAGTTGLVLTVKLYPGSELKPKAPDANVAPQVHIKARFLEVPEEVFGFIRQFPEATNGVTVLPINDAQKLMQMIRARGATSLAEPEIETLSGRQTEVRATDIKVNVISSASLEMHYDYNDLVDSTNDNAMTFKTEPFETGPVLDATPSVLADGYTISLNTTASLTEFFGYANVKDSMHGELNGTNIVAMPMIKPIVRRQQASANVRLWDGQTLAFTKFKTAAAGEENFPKSDGKRLLVLVTVTEVDETGKRVHSDADLPFARDLTVPTDLDPLR
jgi:hypothetical protein